MPLSLRSITRIIDPKSDKTSQHKLLHNINSSFNNEHMLKPAAAGKTASTDTERKPRQRGKAQKKMQFIIKASIKH